MQWQWWRMHTDATDGVRTAAAMERAWGARMRSSDADGGSARAEWAGSEAGGAGDATNERTAASRGNRIDADSKGGSSGDSSDKCNRCNAATQRRGQQQHRAEERAR